MIYIAVGILFIFSLWFFLEPIMSYNKMKVSEEKESYENIKELEKRKIIVLKEIKDIEMEYKGGKLKEKEYLEIRDYLEREISEIMKKIEMLK